MILPYIIIDNFQLLFTKNDADGEEDDERSPTSQTGLAPVAERSQQRSQEKSYHGTQAPDHRHLLVGDADTQKRR